MRLRHESRRIEHRLKGNIYERNFLSFLINQGLTDAGGNPFEGVSAYDPEDDIDAASDRLDLFLTAVDSLNDQCGAHNTA